MNLIPIDCSTGLLLGSANRRCRQETRGQDAGEVGAVILSLLLHGLDSGYLLLQQGMPVLLAF